MADQQHSRKSPKSARELISTTDEDHNFRHDPIDYTTTGGIQRALERNWVAIQRLAAYIDGERQQGAVDGPADQRTAEQARIDEQRREVKAEWAAGTPPGPNGPDDFGAPGVERQTPVNVNPNPPAS